MLAGTCGSFQDIGGSVPSRNAVTMSFMPSAWLLARGPYCPEKAALAKPPPTTVGTPPLVVNPVFNCQESVSEIAARIRRFHGKQLVRL